MLLCVCTKPCTHSVTMLLYIFILHISRKLQLLSNHFHLRHFQWWSMPQKLAFLSQHQKKYFKATLASSKVTPFNFTPDMEFLCLSEALPYLTNATPEIKPRGFLPAEHGTNQRPQAILQDFLTFPVGAVAGSEKPTLHIPFLCQLQLASSWRRVMTPIVPSMCQCC